VIWAAVAIGGAIGSVARHGVNHVVAAWTGRPNPYATFTVNMIGCFAIGLLAGLIAAQRLELTPLARTFVFVGILGGFTTFSSFMLDTLTLASGGQALPGFANAGGQVVLGYLLAYVGYRLGVTSF
jgi:CrcB protein